MADPTARIQWIQYSELVLGENHPAGLPDNDNRPLKQICLYSNLNPQAEDFPGFIGCYQVLADPNGVQTGNVRNAAWDVVGAGLWMKQDGDNTNTGWQVIGNLYGNGSPEGVQNAIDGKIYEQRDADGVNSTWVKRDINSITWLAAEWFNGPNDSNIDGRGLDGGGNATDLSEGTWRRHPITTVAGGRLDIISSVAFTAIDAIETYYYVEGLTALTADCIASCTWLNVGGSSDEYLGVGVRFSATLLNGYLAAVQPDGTVTLYSVALGVKTSLATGNATDIALSGTLYNATLQIRAIGSTLTVYVNGTLICSATDSTYTAVGVPVLYTNGISDTTDLSGSYTVPMYAVGNVTLAETDIGWYSQSGTEYKQQIAIGTGAVAFSELYGSDDETDALPCIAVGYNAKAIVPLQPGISYAASAFGNNSRAIGDGACSFGDQSWALYNGATSIGAQSAAQYSYCTAVGFSSIADLDEAAAFGSGAAAHGENSLAAGANSQTNYDDTNSIALGEGTTDGPNQMWINQIHDTYFGTVEGAPGTAVPDQSIQPGYSIQVLNNVVGTPFYIRGGLGRGSGTPGNIIFQVSAALGSGSTLQTPATKMTISPTGVAIVGNVSITGSLTGGRNVVTYSASMTPNSALGTIQEITATNNTAFAINAPTNPVAGALMVIVIRNTSGGALGVATFNAAFKMTAWTQPATGFSRSITFYYNATNWVEVNRAAADVPN